MAGILAEVRDGAGNGTAAVTKHAETGKQSEDL
jgi:hypothetical protein